MQNTALSRLLVLQSRRVCIHFIFSLRVVILPWLWEHIAGSRCSNPIEAGCCQGPLPCSQSRFFLRLHGRPYRVCTNIVVCRNRIQIHRSRRACRNGLVPGLTLLIRHISTQGFLLPYLFFLFCFFSNLLPIPFTFLSLLCPLVVD